MMKADTQIAVMQMWIGLVLGSYVIASLAASQPETKDTFIQFHSWIIAKC